MNSLRTQRGQSLIEVLIALSASVAVVSAIAVTVITSLSNAEFTKNQNLATQYSREGLEIIRQMAKNNWTSFYNNYTSINYCLDKSNNLGPMTGLNCEINISDSNGHPIFDREINIDQNSALCPSNVAVTSSVLWSDNKCQTGSTLCHQVTLHTCLSNINSVQAP